MCLAAATLEFGFLPMDALPRLEQDWRGKAVGSQTFLCLFVSICVHQKTDTNGCIHFFLDTRLTYRTQPYLEEFQNAVENFYLT